MAIVGDFDAEAVKAQLSELFGTWRAATPYARVPDPLVAKPARTLTLDTPDKANAALLGDLALPKGLLNTGIEAVMSRLFHYAARGADHLIAYHAHHRDKGNTDKQAEQSRRRCEAAFEGCGFKQLADLSADRVERWLGERRELPRTRGGFGAQTSNHYVTALKAFGNWCVRSNRLPENPFRHLTKLNVELDIRHACRHPVCDDRYTTT